MLRTLERAYNVHRSVPKTLYYSPEARVWSLRRPRPRLTVGAETLGRLQKCRADIDAHSGRLGLTHAGHITSALLDHNLLSGLTDACVADHYALKKTLSEGRLPRPSRYSSTPLALEDALEVAKHLGYVIPTTLIREGTNLDDEKLALEATHYLALRRFAPDLIFVTSRFIVPDPLVEVKTAYFFDQLFIVRDAEDGNGVRLLALLIGGAIDDRRDALFTDMGYEVFHVAGPWARSDPQRVVVELFTLAGLSVLPQHIPIFHFRTISDYQCAYCRGPMIRTPSGEGIREVRGRPVHEECVNSAVDLGF